jgi:pyrroline-5-carboxylate reductase
MKIAILGAGNLGLSIGRGLITNNSLTQLYLTRRSVENIASWKEYANTHVTADNKKAVQESDIIILAVQPRQLVGLLEEIKDLLHENHVLISTVTGFSLAKMEETLGTDVFMIRSMPNTAISVGKSMTCLCANKKGAERLPIAEAIFNGFGNKYRDRRTAYACSNCDLCVWDCFLDAIDSCHYTRWCATWI